LTEKQGIDINVSRYPSMLVIIIMRCIVSCCIVLPPHIDNVRVTSGNQLFNAHQKFLNIVYFERFIRKTFEYYFIT